MKCEEIQLMIASAPAGAPPETARAHLAACAECQAFAAVFRYAAAAAVVAAVGWQALRFAAGPGVAPVPVVAVKPALPPTPPPTPPNALPAFRSMEYVSAPSAGATNLLLPAGFHPGALQYGPGNGTVPVKFDY